METIPFIVSLTANGEIADDEMGIFGHNGSAAKVGEALIPVEKLKTNLEQVSRSVLSVIKDIKEVGQYKLKEVTLQVEVSASGGVSLIGTANVGGKGAITLKFAE